MGSFGQSFAAGVQAVQNPQAADRDRQQQLQMKVAPLSQALQADQTRLALYADANDPTKPQAGKEKEYNETLERMRGTIGQMRAALGDNSPHSGILDHLHIRHDLASRVAKYNDETGKMAQTYAAGSLPYEQTPEGQAEKRKAADAEALQKLRNEGYQNRSNNTRPVPYYAGAVNKNQALETVKAGKVYKDSDGNEIDVSKIPDGMFLLPVFAHGGEYYELGTDKGRYETGNNQRQFQPAVGGPEPNAPSIGAARVPTTSSSTSTDSLGVTTTTNRTTTPLTPEAPPKPGPTLHTRPGATPQGGTRTQKLRDAQGGKSNLDQPKQLDENGHIPAGAGNPNLVAMANELIDGKAQKDLKVSTKDLPAVVSLAQQYGYQGEGMFTPRERMQVEQSQQLIDTMRNDKQRMAVFNEGAVKRGVLNYFINNPQAKTVGGNVKDSLMAETLSPEDKDFIADMRNLIGRIQGLAQLTRGSGRPTEAAVKRMIVELPNLITADSPERAKHALDLIQNEIDIGMGKRKSGPETPRTKQLKQTKEQGAKPKLTAADLEKALN